MRNLRLLLFGFALLPVAARADSSVNFGYAGGDLSTYATTDLGKDTNVHLGRWKLPDLHLYGLGGATTGRGLLSGGLAVTFNASVSDQTEVSLGFAGLFTQSKRPCGGLCLFVNRRI